MHARIGPSYVGPWRNHVSLLSRKSQPSVDALSKRPRGQIVLNLHVFKHRVKFYCLGVSFRFFYVLSKFKGICIIAFCSIAVSSSCLRSKVVFYFIIFSQFHHTLFFYHVYLVVLRVWIVCVCLYIRNVRWAQNSTLFQLLIIKSDFRCQAYS